MLRRRSKFLHRKEDELMKELRPMSKWNKVDDIMDLPRDPYPFLALWKGRISICQFNKDEQHFYISFDPAQYETNWKVAKEREGKFTHWMKLPEYPEDY